MRILVIIFFTICPSCSIESEGGCQQCTHEEILKAFCNSTLFARVVASTTTRNKHCTVRYTRVAEMPHANFISNVSVFTYTPPACAGGCPLKDTVFWIGGQTETDQEKRIVGSNLRVQKCLYKPSDEVVKNLTVEQLGKLCSVVPTMDTMDGAQ